MSRKPKKVIIKELIIAKKLLQNSEEIIKYDSIEHNLIAIFNLNSALNIILRVLSTQQKVKSFKQLDSISLEKQWLLLSEQYKKQYGKELSMKTQIFTLTNITKKFTELDIIPTKVQVQELAQALSIFMDDLTSKMFGLELQDIDFHLLLDNIQVQRLLKTAQGASSNEKYEEVLKNTSLAFHIALEDQRQKLNYLSEKGLLRPELLMLDKSIDIHIDSKDQDFIHLVLGTPPKKLERFKQLVPTVLITEDDKGRSEIIVSDFVDETAIIKENAEFCLNFVLETILYWESLELIQSR
jgi:hypothetical protein